MINLKQWTHISEVIPGQIMKLYVNGNLDNQIILKVKGKVLLNDGPLHIGKDPWHPRVKCYLDEFKIYNKALCSKEIKAYVAITSSLIGIN